MAKILQPKDEYLKAIALLRKRKLYRAALRLEQLSQDILNPQPKVKRIKTQNARLRGGSGRSYPIKIALPED